MNQFIARSVLAILGGIAGAGCMGAQTMGSGAPTILHPVNPHEGSAPTAGSTASQTPLITYHGGPVMGTPNVYVIWYGNWNQSNGSDTLAGQKIASDFLYGL